MPRSVFKLSEYEYLNDKKNLKLKNNNLMEVEIMYLSKNELHLRKQSNIPCLSFCSLFLFTKAHER